MHTTDIRHNSSGYYDETAYKAIISADRGSRKKTGKGTGEYEKKEKHSTR